MGIFERFLSIWVALGILAGVGLGLVAPGIFQAVSSLEVAHVNLVVAVFIWVMIFPMMVQIDWKAVKDVGKKPQGLLLTLVINWLVKPFTMAALGVLFFKYLFVPWVDPQSANDYIAGMILLGVAPCTAMVFVWSQLVKGDANYTLVQVSVNDLVMVVAFAPIAAFLLGVTDVTVPWETLLLSTVLYVVLPLAALRGDDTRPTVWLVQDGRVAERFELYACGVELANGFGELTDPEEQRRRFKERRLHPLKQWKLSPIDLASLDKWDDYTRAKEAMFLHCDTSDAPWTVIKSDCKKRARLSAMRYVLHKLNYGNKDLQAIGKLDPLIVGRAHVVYERGEKSGALL